VSRLNIDKIPVDKTEVCQCVDATPLRSSDTIKVLSSNRSITLCELLYLKKEIQMAKIPLPLVRLLFLGSIFAMLLGGCTYTGTVIPNLDSRPYDDKKLPYVLVIDGRKLVGQGITASPGAVKLSVAYGDAFLESIKHRLGGAYKSVYVVDKMTDLKDYDYKLLLNYNMNGTCYASSCNFQSIVHGKLSDTSDTIIFAEDVPDSFGWNVPGSASFLGFITGLTLFVTAPITIPIAVNIEGNELRDQISNSNDRIASKLADAIIYGSLHKTDVKREKPKSKLSRTDIKSPLDDVMDNVVVISTNAGTGSGFYVNDSGFIITNAHVVKDYKEVSIQMRDGNILDGLVIDKDPSADLALIKTDTNHKGMLKLGKLQTSGIGTTVISIGTPNGLEWSVSKGIVSAVRESDGIVYIQTDAAINPGNSGGPLIDFDKKEVIGVITFKLRESEGLNFAVNAEQIKKSFPYLNTQL